MALQGLFNDFWDNVESNKKQLKYKPNQNVQNIPLKLYTTGSISRRKSIILQSLRHFRYKLEIKFRSSQQIFYLQERFHFSD